MAFYIVTDAAADLPQSYVEKQHHFEVIPMPYRLNGEERMFIPPESAASMKEFYQAMADGATVSTAQVALADYQQTFERLLKGGNEVLYIGFSSGLSGTIQSAFLARTMILDQEPGAKLYISDSLCASMGQGLLVHYALKKREEEMNAEALSRWLIDARQQINHWFTVDDLDYLYRGGRLSKTSAFLGGMLGVKPVLSVNYDGKLFPREKVTGRKRSLRTIAEKFAEFAVPKEGQTIFLCHADDEEAAQYVAAAIKKLVPNAGEFVIAPMGAIIGAHTGPGTLALFFLGNSR